MERGRPSFGLRLASSAILLIALHSTGFSVLAAPEEDSGSSRIDCWSWTVDVKSGTYDRGDTVWWKESVRFRNQWTTYTGTWGSTSTLSSRSCTVSNDGGTCTVAYSVSGHSKECESPTLRIDTTPPTCGNWTIATTGSPTRYWSPWQDVTFLPWHWIPWDRSYSVSISDSQSGVPKSSESYVWPSDTLDAPANQSAIMGDLARITVSDNAGNSIECVGPRKRVDGFEPNMPALNCDNFINDMRPLGNPYAGEVKCALADVAGPSKIYASYRIIVHHANLVSGAIGAVESDTGWFSNGSFDPIIIDGVRIRSGSEYEAVSAPLNYAFIPKNDRITKIQGRLCEFVGTSGQRCTDSNIFSIHKLPPPPPIPETAGDGWYDCQDPATGRIVWWEPPVGENGNVWLSPQQKCVPDGTWRWEPKSRAKVVGNLSPAWSAWCWCWDDEPPTISDITVSPSTWTNAPVNFVWTADNLTLGGSPYGGIQYSCDNGATWSTGTTSITANFNCGTSSSSVQTAKVRACDMAKNCSSTRSANFFMETTAPLASSNGYFKLTGKVKNWNGHTLSLTETASNLHTYTPTVTAHLDPSDAGWSGLKSIRLSCNSTFQDSGWEDWLAGASTKSVDLTDAQYSCNSAEGTKTLYLWAKDNAGNVSPSVSASIIYDKTPPNFSTTSPAVILLQATANYEYRIITPTDAVGTSGFRDYSFSWISESGNVTNYFNLPANSEPFSNVFPNEARFVNESCDTNGDGKCVATLRITLQDRAGNATTKEQRIELIAGPVASISGDVTLTSSRGLATATVADLYDRYTYSIHLEDANGNVIRPIPGILDIRADWAFENNASFLGNEIMPSNGNSMDGSVWYNWDDGNWKSSAEGNSISKIYRGIGTRDEGNYVIQVRSAVPTKEGYPGLTTNDIKIKTLAFSNALEVSNAEGCPSGYVCTGTNANGTYGRSLGTDLATNTSINGYLAFKPALEIVPSKTWNTLSDGTWHDIKLSFINNSTQHSFSAAKYAFDFRYEKYLGNFADVAIRWDLWTHSWLGEGNDKKVSFVFTGWLPIVPKGSGSGGGFVPGKVEKTISIRANSYGIGFGKIGFTGYLPWFLETNSICNGTNCSSPLSTTGYNTANLGIDSDVRGFEYQSGAMPDSEFGNSESFGQKFAATGQIADTGKNRMETVESGVSIDTQTMDKAQFRSNVRKNVEDLVRGLSSDNGNLCSVSVTNLTKDVTYYDFSKLSGTEINGNPGCIVTLRGVDTGRTSGYRKMSVSGKKTVIVRWGNVHLDTDLHYADANSMLALVVLRDDTNRAKWGNIYVSPKVTNIVGAGYAEGSLMSYDGTSNKVYDIDNTREGDLTRQLLWYGSLFSSNTIGGSMTSTSVWECPYGSDTYEAKKSKSCSQVEASRYDFALMRRFLLIEASAPAACSLPGKLSPKSLGTTAELYAFAGKKACYQTDANDVPELRPTLKTASFVMEYNPAFATSGMKVFSK